MQKSNTDSEIRARVDAFVADLSDVIRQAALDTVREALGDASSAPAVRRGRKPGRPAGKRGRPAGKKAAKKGGRVRRSSEDLGQLSGTFMTYVKGNPGQRLEEIGTGMGIHTKELKRPVQLLLADGSIRTEGQRRGTKYFAGGGGGKRKAKASGKRKGSKRKGKRGGKRKTTKKAAAAA